MSRIGKEPVKIPEKVEVKQDGNVIHVKGPLGSLETPLYEGISLSVEEGVAKFQRSSEEKKIIALHGLVRALFNNCIQGVSKGWEKSLEIIGVGFRATKKGDDLVLNLGFSHNVTVPQPAGIKVEVTDTTKLKITGIDKQLVGQYAANIRSLKLPEPYKGKGIKYTNEYIKRKAGKTGKK